MHPNPLNQTDPTTGLTFAPFRMPTEIPDVGDVVHVLRSTPDPTDDARAVREVEMTVVQVSEDGHLIAARDESGAIVTSLLYSEAGNALPEPNTWHWPHGHTTASA